MTKRHKYTTIIYNTKERGKVMTKFKIDKNKISSKTINRTIRIKESTYNKLMELSNGNEISFNKVVNECIEYALSHM